MDIKEFRKSLGLSQERLAQKLGVSSMTVMRWEQGKYKPSILAQEAIKRLERKSKPSGTEE